MRPEKSFAVCRLFFWNRRVKFAGHNIRVNAAAPGGTEGLRAMYRAIRRRLGAPVVIPDGPQGPQYRASDYQAILTTHGMIPSMSRKGNCHDNAVAESFFSHLKNELVYHKNFADRCEARSAIFDYIEVFYNRQRLHQTLNYQTPVNYEMMHVA